jgi:hypothetical protein
MDWNQLTADNNTAGSISRWLNNSTIIGDVPEIIVEAESWIYRRLRHWKMLTPPTSGTMVIGQPYIPNPADMLEPFLLWTTGNYFQVMDQKTPQEVILNWSYNGDGSRTQQQPVMYYQDQTNLNFDSPPDQAYGYNLIYFQQPAPLSNSNPTNFLTATYPRLMRTALMAAGCEWAKDSGQGNYDRTYWDQIAQDEIDKAQAESDRAKRATIAGMVLIGGGQSSNFPAYVTGY